MYILNYNCITAAGFGPESMMKALQEGRDVSRKVDGEIGGRPSIPGGRICAIDFNRSGSYQRAFDQYFNELWPSFEKTTEAFQTQRVGVIFSSTKGLIEDFIWETGKARDPLTPLLEKWISDFKIPAHRWLSISNACASSHVALEVAENWLSENLVDSVLVIAADLVGPFIYNGFQSLRALSLTNNRPFSADRDGLQLGEAFVVMVLSTTPGKSNFRLVAVNSETEGQSVTRPSSEGHSLARAGKEVLKKYNKPVSAVMAHGTGTLLNDRSEDLALSMILGSNSQNIPITSTKWCLGHTLGTSGCVDLIAAMEALKSQTLFKIHSTVEKDPTFKGRYLTQNSDLPDTSLESFLITSLGFGGIHAAMIVEKANHGI